MQVLEIFLKIIPSNTWSLNPENVILGLTPLKMLLKASKGDYFLS